MKIILISRGDPSVAFAGTEILAGNLAVELARLGHEVSFIYGVERSSTTSRSLGAKGVCVQELRVIGVPFLSAFDFRRKCANSCGMLLRKGGFDAVLALGAGTFPGYIFGKIRSGSCGSLLVYYAMDSMIMECVRSKFGGANEGLSSRLKNWIWYKGLIRSDRLSCNRSNLILASSKDTFYHIVADYGVSSKKVRLLYEGVPDDFAHGVAVSDPLVPTFLHIGGGVRKGSIFFLEALKLLRERYGLRAKGVVTRAEASLEGKVAELEVDVELRRRVSNEELKQLFASCTALVSPSLSEGFCLPVVEAMMFGKTCIVSNMGSLPELVEDGCNGFVVPAGDADELSERMHQIAVDSGLRRRLSEQSKMASKKYEISDVTKSLVTTLLQFKENDREKGN